MSASSQPSSDSWPKHGLVLHLIHGTWSDGKDWMGEEAPFRKLLEHRFGNEVRINPIKWSGDNRDAERREAKAKVVSAVRNANDQGVDQFLIGHSHGGNVAAYAAADPEISNLVRGVVCLSTPFIAVLPREFVFRAIFLVVCVCFGPINLLADRLLHLVLQQPNDLLRIAVGVLAASLSIGTILVFLRPILKKARSVARRLQFSREDSVNVLAVSSGEDEALSGLVLFESFASLFRLLQHPILVIALVIVLLGLTTAHALPSPIVPSWEAWRVAEVWVYATGYLLACALLETAASAACWRVGLGLAWRDFPFLSAFFVRVTSSPVPLNYSRVEFYPSELVDGKSLLAHCRIYNDTEAQQKVVSWIESQRSNKDSTSEEQQKSG